MISPAPLLINKSVQTEIACVLQQREAIKSKDAQSYSGIWLFLFVFVCLVLFGNRNLFY